MSTATAASDVLVPDIGDFTDVPIIEILVSPGDTVAAEDPLVTLESDKATMDVPSPMEGVVQEIKVSVGDSVSEGTLLLTLTAPDAAEEEQATESLAEPAAEEPAPAEEPPTSRPPRRPSPRSPRPPLPPTPARARAGSPASWASTSRRSRAPGARAGSPATTCARSRRAGGKPAEAAPAAAPSGGDSGLELLPWPSIDFSKYGEVEVVPLSRIRKISGANLARNWVRIPHVTHNDEADITDLEALRKQLNEEYKKQEVRVTMLAFLIKACVAGLKQFPDFNASLDGDNLIVKNYYNVGFAADTPNGLVVPVVKDADTKGVIEIANEMGELSWRRARASSSRATWRAATSRSPASAGSAGRASRRSSTRRRWRSSGSCARR